MTGALMPVQHVAPKPKLDFSRDILPVLADKCFKCHGPDATSRMANLRFDLPEGAFANRAGRFAIVPGKPQDSLMVKRIESPDDPMPPKSSGKSLSTSEIATIKRWIAEGAHYGKMWSFNPIPTSIPVPKIASSWPRNDLDRFILSRIAAAGLAPSPPASRLRWLRRVTLDLTGLPPTEQDIDAFRSDASADAYGRVVDRLLASPHFGERVAVDWLDAARYSDSYGYQADLLSPTWPYRDWVVKAFNENLPYSQFLVDQIAGDRLKSPTRDQILATAFNRLHRQSNEGGSIPLELKTEYTVDRVSTFGTAVLGLTVGCARCHDHKFDPISQKDFYQLFAYFNSIDDYGLYLSTEIVPTPSLLLPSPAQDAELKKLHEQDDAAVKRLDQARSDAEPRYDRWLAARPTEPAIPDVVAHFPLDSCVTGKFLNATGGKSFGEKLMNVELVAGKNGPAVLLDGDNGVALRGLPGRERWDAFTWAFWIRDTKRAPEPEILMHRTGGTDVGFCGFDVMLENGFLTARVIRQWPGNAVAVRTRTQVAKDRWSHVAWSWDGSGHAAGLKIYVDGKPAETTVLADSLWKKINAYGDLGPSNGDWAFGQRFRDAGFKAGLLSDVTFAERALSSLEVAQLFDGTALKTALASPSSHAAALTDYYVRAIDSECRAAQKSVQSAQMALAIAEDSVFEVSVMKDTPVPTPAYVLARGRYDAPRTAANLVDRNVPRALPRLNAIGNNDRLALAAWTTRGDNPLTARVAVNRLWQLIFGVGLVETTENFGMQGSPPSHPELLDYLARRFIDSGWNVKALVKFMVTSATYRQDSTRTAKLSRIDPANRLFARGPSGRLSAEMIRDTVLAASGLLNPTIGGSPVNPYQPAGIWQENNTMSPDFVQSKGADLYRRSLYTTWKRTTPVPTMLLFDATSREACVVRRQTTNTPLQALALLNDVQFVEAARALAELVLKQDAGNDARIRTAFRRLAGRDPDGRELAILMETLKEQRAQFASDPAAATRFVHVGDSKPSSTVAPVDLASMTATVQAAMNSDAVIWKR